MGLKEGQQTKPSNTERQLVTGFYVPKCQKVNWKEVHYYAHYQFNDSTTKLPVSVRTAITDSFLGIATGQAHQVFSVTTCSKAVAGQRGSCMHRHTAGPSRPHRIWFPLEAKPASQVPQSCHSRTGPELHLPRGLVTADQRQSRQRVKFPTNPVGWTIPSPMSSRPSLGAGNELLINVTFLPLAPGHRTQFSYIFILQSLFH